MPGDSNATSLKVRRRGAPPARQDSLYGFGQSSLQSRPQLADGHFEFSLPRAGLISGTASMQPATVFAAMISARGAASRAHYILSATAFSQGEFPPPLCYPATRFGRVRSPPALSTKKLLAGALMMGMTHGP